jgi:SAM-dependent methyltransferase
MTMMMRSSSSVCCFNLPFFRLTILLVVVSRSPFVADAALAFATTPSSRTNNNNYADEKTYGLLPTIESSIDDLHGRPNFDDDDWTAASSFGRKQYWDDVYEGRGDFPAEQYSWYYGYDDNALRPHIQRSFPARTERLLLPGIGNDILLLDLLRAGYTDLTAQDYSRGALERQLDMLRDASATNSGGYASSTTTTTKPPRIVLSHSDVTNLPFADATFDGIIEKGLLDAVYLSGPSNEPDRLVAAVRSLTRCLRPGGIFISISGVVPAAVRAVVFGGGDQYEWLRDGTKDLKAGCFILQKKTI